MSAYLVRLQGELKFPYTNVIPNRALYATGEEANLSAVRSAARAHQVTVNGAVLAAVTVAFIQQRLHEARQSSAKAKAVSRSEPLSMVLDVDFNRRKPGRLKLQSSIGETCMGNDHVGLNISFATCVALTM